MKIIMENFRRFSEQACTGGQCENPVPSSSRKELESQLNDINAALKASGPKGSAAYKEAQAGFAPEIKRIKQELANLPEAQVKEQAGENIPALKQPLDIGAAAAAVGGLNLEDGYLYYTINGKRPRSSSDIEKLATPGSVLRHHFKKGVNLNKMTDLIKLAQQGRATKSVTSQRAHPARAFFEAGLAFRMSPDIKNNAVKLVVSKAPHLNRREEPAISPGLPPQR